MMRLSALQIIRYRLKGIHREFDPVLTQVTRLARTGQYHPVVRMHVSNTLQGLSEFLDCHERRVGV